jgi:hypothetical protein
MTLLYERLKDLKTSNPYFGKDMEKANKSNKYIGQGSANSSTNKYRLAAGNLANTGHYESDDIVFVSAEGNRTHRLSIDRVELQLAVDANVTFMTDNAFNRNRPYNIGEREVEFFLKKNGYQEVSEGCWKKIP